MFDGEARLLYVGKAKNLKKRLASYFRKTGQAPKTAALVARIAQIETTITANETEALLLEQTLIKEWRPPYNILLRDDKSYPYVFLSDGEFPRLGIHRGAKKHKGRYFGPYPSAGAIRESVASKQQAAGEQGDQSACLHGASSSFRECHEESRPSLSHAAWHQP